MFITGKLLIILLNPLLWIVCIFLYARFTRKEPNKKRAYLTGIALLLFFSNPLVIDKLTIAYQAKRYSLEKNETYSAGILLGGFVGLNKADNQVYFGENSDRFIQASQLYATGHIKKIIIAAGSGEVFTNTPFREADYVFEQLTNLCISREDVFADRDSRNTFENALNAKRIIDSLHLPPPYLLITSAIHIPRAVATFEKAGLTVKPFPAAFYIKPDKGFKHDYFIPSPKALENWNTLIKEVVGNILYRILGRG